MPTDSLASNNPDPYTPAKDVLGATGLAAGGGLLGYSLYKYLQTKKKPSAVKVAFLSEALGAVKDVGEGIGNAASRVFGSTTPSTPSVWADPRFTVPVGVGVPLAGLAAWKLRNKINNQTNNRQDDSEMAEAKRQFEEALLMQILRSKEANAHGAW